MDISKLISLPSAKCVIKHPLTGENTDIVIELSGIDSSIFRKSAREIALDKANGKDIGDGEVNLLARCTLSWENVELYGEPLECTVEDAMKIYSEVYTIKEQCENFISTKGNFFLNV